MVKLRHYIIKYSLRSKGREEKCSFLGKYLGKHEALNNQM